MHMRHLETLGVEDVASRKEPESNQSKPATKNCYMQRKPCQALLTRGPLPVLDHAKYPLSLPIPNSQKWICAVLKSILMGENARKSKNHARIVTYCDYIAYPFKMPRVCWIRSILSLERLYLAVSSKPIFYALLNHLLCRTKRSLDRRLSCGWFRSDRQKIQYMEIQYARYQSAKCRMM